MGNLRAAGGSFNLKTQRLACDSKPCYNRARLEQPPQTVKQKIALRQIGKIVESSASGMKPAEPKPYLKIGDVARLVGVSPSVIRSWESLGLTRPHRTASKYRLYTPEDVKLLKRARFLRKVRGLNAPAIVQLLKRDGLLRPRPNGAASAIGTRLRQLRIRRGLSLAQVAKAVGISVGFLSALERSQMSASVATLRKLARFYKTNILDFFDPAESNIRLVSPDEAQGAGSRPGRAHGIAGLGQHGDGAAPVSHRSPVRQRRVLHPRRRGIPVHPAGRIADFSGRRGVPSASRATVSISRAPRRIAGKTRAARETWVLWVNTPPTF